MTIALYWNCCSGLLKKLDYIKDLIETIHPDVFFISEVEVRLDFDLGCLSIQGYETHFSKTLFSRGKSRLMGLVKAGIEVVEIGTEFDEILAFNINDCNVVGIYRPFKCFSGETELTNFNRLTNSLDGLDFMKKTFIIGDYNIDPTNETSRFYNELQAWIGSRGLRLADAGISRSRWVLDRLQESVLDYLITNYENAKISKEFSDLSDHFLIRVDIASYAKPEGNKQIRELINWNFDKELAKSYLKDWFESKSIMSCNSVYQLDYWIRAGLISAFRKFVKIRRITVRSNEVISDKIIRLRNKKNKLKKKWFADKNALNYVNMVRAARMLRKEVRRQRQKSLLYRISKGPKEFWGEVNKLRGVKNTDIKYIEKEGKKIVNDTEIADEFIEFFTGKVDRLLGNYSPSIPTYEGGMEQECHDFSEVEIKNAFARLSNKKGSGMDNLSGFFVKIFETELTSPLAKLFNLIKSSLVVPPLWKIAKIFPVHKKGVISSVSNYRPVSNILSVAKLFELCILQRLESMDLDELMGTSQHGFRKKHSTVTAITEIIDTISEELDNKNTVGIYSADLTAAFDLLQKEKMVEVLIRKRIPLQLVKIIHNYLEDRSGYVQVREGISCVRDIRAGCIQGSILGPILFNIYTSSLNEIVSPCTLVAYADDAYVIASGKNSEIVSSLLKVTLKSHFEWLEEIGMHCNQSKTEFMIFGEDKFNIEISGVKIPPKDQMKVLGTIIDNKLDWKPHVNRTIAKCHSYIFPLRYLRKHLSIENTIKVLRAQVISVLTYACPAWGNSLSYNQRAKIRSVYYLAIRTVLRDFNLKLNRNTMLAMTKLESIDDIFYKISSGFFFGLYYSLEPTSLAAKLMSRAYTNDRHPGKVEFFDLSKYKIGKKSPLNTIRTFTNRWNFEWTNLSPQSFKSSIKAQFQIIK